MAAAASLERRNVAVRSTKSSSEELGDPYWGTNLALFTVVFATKDGGFK